MDTNVLLVKIKIKMVFLLDDLKMKYKQRTNPYENGNESLHKELVKMFVILL